MSGDYIPPRQPAPVNEWNTDTQLLDLNPTGSASQQNNASLDNFFSQTNLNSGGNSNNNMMGASNTQMSNPFGNMDLTTPSPQGQMTSFDNVHPTGNGDSSAKGGLPSSVQNQLPEFLKNAKHPIVCLFHLLFKALCLFCYFFGSYLWSNAVLTYIFCILFLAFDFWTVKNVTGRLLVGLRWWNMSSLDDGSNDGQEQELGSSTKPSNADTEWVFESLQDESQLDVTDKNIFWLGIYGWALVWLVLLFINVISLNLSWLVFLIIANIFAFTNLVAFWKCSRDQKSKLQSYVTETMFNSVASNAGGFFQKIGRMV